jgi:hypothetical protein
VSRGVDLKKLLVSDIADNSGKQTKDRKDVVLIMLMHREVL